MSANLKDMIPARCNECSTLSGLVRRSEAFLETASRLIEYSVECGRSDYAAAMDNSQQVEDEERRKINLLLDRCNQELDTLPDQVFTFMCRVAVKDVPPELF